MSPRLEAFLVLVPIMLGSLTLHELAHAWVADRLGDPTARLLGRLTLNPIAHLDPLGTLMLVLTYWAPGGFLFGWARPVPVNPANLRGHPQRGMALVGAAGPATNFLLAVGFAWPLAHGTYADLTTRVLYAAFLVNVVLGVFNLLPVPPLDGSRIVGGLMSRPTYVRWAELDRYGMFVVLGLFFLLPDQFNLLLGGAIDHVTSAIGALVGGDLPT